MNEKEKELEKRLDEAMARTREEMEAASAPCTRCGATPEQGLTPGCPVCEGITDQ